MASSSISVRLPRSPVWSQAFNLQQEEKLQQSSGNARRLAEGIKEKCTHIVEMEKHVQRMEEVRPPRIANENVPSQHCKMLVFESLDFPHGKSVQLSHSGSIRGGQAGQTPADAEGGWCRGLLVNSACGAPEGAAKPLLLTFLM